MCAYFIILLCLLYKTKHFLMKKVPLNDYFFRCNFIIMYIVLILLRKSRSLYNTFSFPLLAHKNSYNNLFIYSIFLIYRKVEIFKYFKVLSFLSINDIVIEVQK